MDTLQIKHAISQIEIYQDQLKRHLLDDDDEADRIDELESELSTAEEENDRLCDEVDDLKTEVMTLTESISEVRKLLLEAISEPAGNDYYVEQIEKAIELL